MSKIIVLGDVCRDVNYFGEVKRISPEAPVPIFSITSQEEKPGMSGNVARNLSTAGDEVVLITKNYLGLPYTVKSRYFANGHYLYRIDKDETDPLTNEQQLTLIKYLASEVKDAKAVLLQDYNKGFFDEDFMWLILETIRNENPHIPIIADGNKARNLEFYAGVDYLKVNTEEYEAVCKNYNYHFDYIIKGILLTEGERGARLIKMSRSIAHREPAKKVIDVTGAGDTFVAWFASELVGSGSEDRALEIATIASAISVEHLGCYAPTQREVRERL